MTKKENNLFWLSLLIIVFAVIFTAYKTFIEKKITFIEYIESI